ncbi:MAG: hypothetical protein MJZ30_06150 [Paludibacteraceae bacterium]|nr:hypothetical protein [Paludibacteraceae bacterium]
MKDIELSKTLHSEALSLGLCDKWSNEWKDEDSKQALCDKFKKGFDFIVKNNWPTPEFIDENFDKDFQHRNLIYTNDEINEDFCENGIYILNGRCAGSMHFGWYNACTLHIRHDSVIDICADGSSVVFVRVYDNAKVYIKQQDNARAFVKTFGNNCSVKISGNVKIRKA